MSYESERRSRYYRSPSRKAAPPIVSTGPGVFGIGSYRPGQRLQPINDGGGGFNTFMGQLQGGIEDFAKWAIPKLQDAQPVDPLQAIIDQLLGGIGGSTNYGAQARAEAAAQYDPQIAAVNAAMARARRSTEYNQAGVDSLYDALAASYPADLRASKQTFKEAKRSERDISREGREAISGGYQEAEQNLANVMQQLGIQEAGTEVLPGIAADQAEALRSEAERTATEQSAYNRQATGERAYYQQGPGLAREAGTQGQQYLGEQLNQFLLEQEAQRAQLESQRALTERSLLGQYRSQGANQGFSNLKDVFNMILSLRKFQADQMNAGPATKPSYEGLSGSAQVLGELVGPGRGEQLQGDLMTFLMDELSGGTGQPSYPAALSKLRDFSEDRQYSSMDANALMQALAAYLGVYR